MIPLGRCALNATVCDKVFSYLRQVGGFFRVLMQGLSPNKTDRYDMTEILLKVVLGTINVNLSLTLIPNI